MGEKTSFIVGKCKACGKPIDNSLEGYITDAQDNLYHVPCYSQLESKSQSVTASKRGRTR